MTDDDPIEPFSICSATWECIADSIDPAGGPCRHHLNRPDAQRRIADGELQPRELGPARTDADVLKRVALEARKVR